MNNIKQIMAISAICVAFCSNSAFADDGVEYTIENYFASPSEEILDKAIQYFIVKDAEAIGRLMESGLLIMLKGGVKVYVVDTKLFSGRVKIRPVGQIIELWTSIEAITDVPPKQSKK